MKIENTKCFDYVTIYTVEVPVQEHKRPEVIEAKDKEIENLEKYGVFEEVLIEEHEMVGSRQMARNKIIRGDWLPRGSKKKRHHSRIHLIC